MSVNQILKDAEHKMQSAIDAMTHDFASYRTGRASPAVLDRVTVEYYGADTPITQVASVTVPEPRQLLISPYDRKMIPLIERANPADLMAACNLPRRLKTLSVPHLVNILRRSGRQSQTGSSPTRSTRCRHQTPKSKPMRGGIDSRDAASRPKDGHRVFQADQ